MNPTYLEVSKKFVDGARGHMGLGSAGLVVVLMISGGFPNCNDPMLL